jgi:hypothetical protein
LIRMLNDELSASGPGEERGGVGGMVEMEGMPRFRLGEKCACDMLVKG